MARIRSFSFTQSRKDLDRIGHILNILVKFQVETYVDKILHAERQLHVRISKRSRATPEIIRMSPQERFALMLEELGTSFVKFGQVLATRPDLIDPSYAAELAKLHDRVKPFPSEVAKAIVEEELGQPISKIFSRFEDKPMASASIAQVHRATLKNGKRVVVKVQRPEIEDDLREDIRIMHYLAYLTEKNIPELREYDPQYLVDEFERSVLKELDFMREAKNAGRLKENFKEDKGVYVPTVYSEYSTKRVLTIEEVRGTRLTDIIASKADKFDKKLIARRCVKAYFQMILVDGFYHSDPHPGNIMILNHNVVCFLDFGRCATIDKEVAESILRLVLFAVNDDVNGLVAHMVRTGLIEERGDMRDLKADITDLLDAYYSPNLRDIQVGDLMSDLLAIIKRYGFNRPRELAELTRTLLILEGEGKELDPKFNIAEEFEPYARGYLVEKFDTNKVVDIIKNDLLDFQYIAKEFPSAIRRLMRKVAEGKITLQLEHKNLDTITSDLKDMTDRLSVAMILAALIIGSSVIVHAVPSNWLALLLFGVSAAVGVWVVLKTLVL